MSITRSDDLLAQLASGFPRLVELSLRPAYYELLQTLGHPHQNLPPVIHVAGTNGKGSTCAFLRAILEAAGKRVHVYTSPHLVRFHERIRLAGQLIDEAALVALLEHVATLIKPGSISQFEATTAAAFKAFSETPADVLILETGLGGRYDATNVVAKPLATAITRLSYDHREFLGDTLEKIAWEKAGIIKSSVSCFVSQQQSAEVLPVFAAETAAQHASLLLQNAEWRIEPLVTGFRYNDASGMLDLPMPALLGEHQLVNAALAIAVVRHAWPEKLPDCVYAQAMQKVEWPGRLQKLTMGALAALLPPDWECWLDGGHNDSAGEVLAAQAAEWQRQDGAASKPLHLIYGMLNTKTPHEFLRPLAPFVKTLQAVPIPDTPNCLPVSALLHAAQESGITSAAAAPDVPAALHSLIRTSSQPARMLICGSLYLVGAVLSHDE